MRTSALTVALVAGLAGAARAQVPAGGEFQVNTYTTHNQGAPRLSIGPAGDFVAVWTSQGQPIGSYTTHAQRYQADGAPAGGEFRVDSGSFGAQPAVTHAHTGRFAVAWSDTSNGARDVHARQFTAQGLPRGAEFTVNTLTAGTEFGPEMAPLPGGGFVVTWSQYLMPGTNPQRIAAQRYDAFGVPVGGEMQVNAATTGGFTTSSPSVSSSADGRFVVAWLQDEFTGPELVMVRAYDPAGVPLGPPTVAQSSPARDEFPGVAMKPDGAFVVVWQSESDGFGTGIRARLFSPGGAPVGADFAVNAVTLFDQRQPFVAADRRGNFVIAWSSGFALESDAFARRFDASGAPRGGEFQVNTSTPGFQAVSDVAVDEAGNFTVGWTSDSQDGSGVAAMARRFGGLLPSALAVDTALSATSDGNGVLEPGEAADVRPSWRNVNGVAQAFTGAVTLFGGPPGPTHSVVDAAASYGTVASGSTGPCGDCYVLGVSAPVPRPVQHWDGVFHEDLAPDVQGQRKEWRLHVGDTFTDVPRANIYYRFVETLIHNFVTAGCAATSYCPQAVTTREQMSVFVLVARDAAGDAPPVCTAPLFADVPASSGYCRWIEELARSGVATGCGGGNFCPQDPVSREQMAVFVLRTLDGTFTPPACGTPSMFADVPASSPYCRWIEELARRGIVTGCGGGNFCPTATVTREQMAVFISGTFGLKLYGPQLP